MPGNVIFVKCILFGVVQQRHNCPPFNFHFFMEPCGGRFSLSSRLSRDRPSTAVVLPTRIAIEAAQAERTIRLHQVDRAPRRLRMTPR